MSSPSVIPGQPGPLKPGEYQSGSIPNVVTFEFDRVGPPSPLYVQRDDTLFLSATMDNTVSAPIFQWRHLLAPFKEGGQPAGRVPQASMARIISRGKIEPGRLQLTPVLSPGLISLRTVQLAEGFLLSMTAIEPNVAARGRVFARAALSRPLDPSSSLSGYSVLFGDYISQGQYVGWPGARQLNPQEGPGFMESLPVSAPGPGADWLFTVPGWARVRFQYMTATLTTSAVAGNRSVLFRHFSAGGNLLFQGVANQAIPASTVAGVSVGAVSGSSLILGNIVTIPFPGNIFSNPADRFDVSTAGLLAGDQWSNITMTWERWLNDA